MQHRNNKLLKPQLRRQYSVAPEAQGRILYSAILYCLLSSLVTVAVFGSISMAYGNTPRAWAWFVPVAVACCCVLPLVLRDAAVVSNQLIGPFARVIGAIRRLACRDEVVHPLSVREHELWHEWMQDFNAMIVRVQSQLTSNVSDVEQSP